jgi:hypothetical protein
MEVVRFARLMHRRVRAFWRTFGPRRLRRQSQPPAIATQGGTEVGAVGAGAGGLVGSHRVGPCAGAACTDTREVYAVQNGLELGRVTALPGGHD